MWQKSLKKTIFTLNIDGYAPEITEISYPLMKHYAEKIGADFYVIKDRKYPGYPPVYEKLQIYELAQEMRNDWNIYIDSDALIHPDLMDLTNHISKDTVAHNGHDTADNRWRYDRFFHRDGRHIGSCLEAGTMVSGSGAIECVESNSEVLNKTGMPQKITHSFKRLYSGNIISLKVACLPSIKITPDHPILVCTLNRKYKEGLNPVTGAKAWNEKVFTEPEWKEAKDVKPDDWVLSPRIKTNENANLEFSTQGWREDPRPRKFLNIAIDEDVAWLIGLYVAEGYVTENQRLNFSLGSHEKEMADRAAAILKEMGVSARLDFNGHGVLKVISNCSGLARLFDKRCGHGAVNKHIPKEIMNASENIARAFIVGLLAGDGCLFEGKKGSKGYRLATISRQLAFDVISLCHKFGVHVHAGNPRKNTPTIQGRKVNTHPVYEVNISYGSYHGLRDKQGCLPKGHACFTKDMVYLPIRETVKLRVTDLPVYNIETQDHTYGVPFVVHNCNWFTIASDWCIELWKPLEDLTLEEAVKNIYPTVHESNTIISPDHLIDDYILSRNIAKYGLKFTTFNQILKGLGYEKPGFLWHQYTISIEEKVVKMKEVLKAWRLT